MKAIVLTYDVFAEITDLVLCTYAKLWPDNPFTFHIPYQQQQRCQFLREKHDGKVVLVRAPAPIKPTMLALLDGIDDNEWVWWCIADKFLKAVDARAAGRASEWLCAAEPQVGGLMISLVNRMDRQLLRSEPIDGPSGQLVYRKKNWWWAFYQHQFLRAGVLREVFLDRRLRDHHSIYDFDNLLRSYNGPIRNSYPFAVWSNMLLFGETTSRGRLTPDCLACFKLYTLEPPKHVGRAASNVTALRHVSGPDAEMWRRRLAQWDAEAANAGA